MAGLIAAQLQVLDKNGVSECARIFLYGLPDLFRAGIRRQGFQNASGPAFGIGNAGQPFGHGLRIVHFLPGAAFGHLRVQVRHGLVRFRRGVAPRRSQPFGHACQLQLPLPSGWRIRLHNGPMQNGPGICQTIDMGLAVAIAHGSRAHARCCQALLSRCQLGKNARHVALLPA